MKSKRILCVTSNFPRWEGDSTTPFVLHLAQDLQALGWEIDVLAPHAVSTSSYEVLGGVNVSRFRYLWPERFETVCYQGGALINLKQNRMNYLKLPALIFFEWAAITKRLIRGKYDLLHSHWMLPQGFTGVLAAKPLHVPHVITVHGSDAFVMLRSGVRVTLSAPTKSIGYESLINAIYCSGGVKESVFGTDYEASVPRSTIVGCFASQQLEQHLLLKRSRFCRDDYIKTNRVILENVLYDVEKRNLERR